MTSSRFAGLPPSMGSSMLHEWLTWFVCAPQKQLFAARYVQGGGGAGAVKGRWRGRLRLSPPGRTSEMVGKGKVVRSMVSTVQVYGVVGLGGSRSYTFAGEVNQINKRALCGCLGLNYGSTCAVCQNLCFLRFLNFPF